MGLSLPGRVLVSGAIIASGSKCPSCWHLLRGIRLRGHGVIVPAPAPATAERALRQLGKHPGPLTGGGGPVVERAH